MADLEEAVVEKAMALLWKYESGPHTGIQALDHGIGYVLFAWEEPNLFGAINDRGHIGMQTKFGDLQFDEHVEELTRNPRMQGLSRQQMRDFQFLAWIFVHGIASIKNWMDEKQGHFPQEYLIELIRNGSKALTHGFTQIRPRPLKMTRKMLKGIPGTHEIRMLPGRKRMDGKSGERIRIAGVK